MPTFASAIKIREDSAYRPIFIRINSDLKHNMEMMILLLCSFEFVFSSRKQELIKYFSIFFFLSSSNFDHILTMYHIYIYTSTIDYFSIIFSDFFNFFSQFFKHLLSFEKGVFSKPSGKFIVAPIFCFKS